MKKLDTLITIDRLAALRLLALCAPEEGVAAEVGVYRGGSLRLIAETLKPRQVFGFDTFAGLPAGKWQADEVHHPGQFADTSLESVTEYLSDLPNVTLVKGVFPESASTAMGLCFSFVHIDTDFYLSVKQSIDYFLPRLLPGGIMLFDDYGWRDCPGVVRALQESGLKLHQSASIQAFFINR